MPARRMRYSTLLWPQLYSPQKILLLFAAAVVTTLALVFGAYLLTQPDATVYPQAAERARAALQMKLAGVDVWRWRENFACRHMPDECLKLVLRFGQPDTNAQQHLLALPAPEPCAICHANETNRHKEVLVIFPTIPAKSPLLWPAMTTAGILTVGWLWFGFYFIELRRRTKHAGNCIAALGLNPGAPQNIQRWFRRQLKSPFSASYVEREDLRMRWITTPDKFRYWLGAERQNLTNYRDFVKLIAVHGEAARTTALPVEILRIVYRFLVMPAASPALIDERLFANKEEIIINMRRLVAKNKSGASLRLVIWEPD